MARFVHILGPMTAPIDPSQKSRNPLRGPLNRVTARLRRARNRHRRWLRTTFARRFRAARALLTLPSTVIALGFNDRIHPSYRLGWRRKFGLAWRMYRNTRRVFTGTSYKAHLAMAVKLLEIPPDVEGEVVECGCFYGGSTANLSLACAIVGRRLIVYDSFEGLPPPEKGDRYATDSTQGLLAADIDRVRATVGELGAIEVCEFRKGWFKDTLPDHGEPVVLCFLDVDYQSSLRDCVLGLWPHLTDRGLMFIDEYVLVDYCALFFSERFWSRHFGRPPPGLIGAGSGVGLGEYYLGPFEERVPIQAPRSVAYTRKDFEAVWNFDPPVEPG
jgi:O-methyltransferase